MANNKILNKYKYWIFYMVVFTLPMFTKLNNTLLILFIALGLIEIGLSTKRMSLSHFLFKSWPVLVFFGLSLLASLRTFDFQAFKFLENHWSLLFIPLVMLTNAEKYNNRRREIFLALLAGTTLTLLICNVNHVLKMLSNEIVLNNWFNWEYFGQEFTQIADTHPAYLGLFVVTSILFLIQDNTFKKTMKFALLIILLLGLFQLMSEITLFLFILFFLYLGVANLKKHRQQSVLMIVGLSICTFVFFIYGEGYMKNRMFFVDTIFDEKRVERWEVSYEIFREHPFIGVGYARIDEIRKEKYIEGDYPLAAAKDLNAHNQFLEYLSIDGAVGGFTYAISLGFLFLLSIQRRDHLFTFVFFAFILANLTESMMVRIKGIEYFAIFASLFLCSGRISGKGPDENYLRPKGTSQ